MNKKITLGFSPCPNDCFIFDALVHNRIDTEGLEFETTLADVETLNLMAFNKQLNITKLSFHAYAHLTENYILLNAGSALGFNCGPLLISKKEMSAEQVNNSKIGIPGKYTTANFLLSLAFPEAKNKIEMSFSEIEDAVLSGKIDAGLIIHENRFTYEQKGLKKIMDLGEFWEGLIHAPIPLGGIVAQRTVDENLIKKIDRLIKKSIEHAFAYPEQSMPYIKANAQEMQEEVMKKHIALYVNDYTIDLGEKGKQAVQLLFNTAFEKGIINKLPQQIIIGK